MKKIYVEVIQPNRTIIKGEFDHVIVPGTEGDFGVYSGHTPFITMIRPGILEVFTNDDKEGFAIHDGFVSVENNKVTIVCEKIEKADGIDVRRAEEAKLRAEKRMKHSDEETDFRRAEFSLKRALVRLSLGQ
ncbi:MAG: F0F1 ATP synthase subunit epsilon [Candidatus Cloacimonetes bacterium]|nr:F0F1 ATP synthase subunit epsilon [Candidatus Cloacimonadota bacterium]